MGGMTNDFLREGFPRAEREGARVIIEPINTIKCVLEWLTRTEHAQANVSFTPEYGWNFTLFVDTPSEIELELEYTQEDEIE